MGLALEQPKKCSLQIPDREREWFYRGGSYRGLSTNISSLLDREAFWIGRDLFL
jgi:hypothetical protein